MLNTSKEWFLSLSHAARAGLIIGACAILVIFVALSYWTLSTDYQVLFSDLDPQDGSAIITELDRMKVPYRFEDGGKTILVEKDQVYKTRLKLMGKGVTLKGTVGFEIFNESDFGMTDFAQRINYQRALQGEITRTIMGLEEVQSARVHIVVPEKSFLKKDENQTKASITITPKPGQQLTSDEIFGIQRLVAAAVPGIEVPAVTILDNRGVALTRPAGQDQDSTGTLENKLAMKQQTEAYFIKKIAAILDKTFGPGKAIVSVDVTLNHDSIKVTREDILPAVTRDGDPDGAVIRKKKSSTHHHKKKKAAIAQAEQSEDESAAPAESTNEETEYVHGKKIEQLISNPGAIKRISVGVILPNNIDSAKIEMLSKVISMVAGLNVGRGDALAVYPIDSFSAKEMPDQGTLARAKTQGDQKSIPLSGIASNSQNSSIIWKNVNTYLFIGLALCLAISLYLVLVVLRRRSAGKHLSEKQREEMLKEIQIWLEKSTPSATRGV